MHKRIAPRTRTPTAPTSWLLPERIATIEVTSEAPDAPIEHALRPDNAPTTGGWRAGTPGTQHIRLHLAEPHVLKRVRLVFRETARSRTQEFVLRWSHDGATFTEGLRQQYNFAPPATTEEIEEYEVNPGRIAAVELEITPDISGGTALATLQEWRLA